MNNTIQNYNKILQINNQFDYPYNIISNLNFNIIETKKEVELEYIKDFFLKEETTEKDGGLIYKDIIIYFY